MSVPGVPSNDFFQYLAGAKDTDEMGVLCDFVADETRVQELKALIVDYSSRANKTDPEIIAEETTQFYTDNVGADDTVTDDIKFLWVLWWLVYKEKVEKKEIA